MKTATLLWAGAAIALVVLVLLVVLVRRRARQDASRLQQAEMLALLEAQRHAKALAAERAQRQEAAAREARAREAAEYAEALRLRAQALEAAERETARRADFEETERQRLADDAPAPTVRASFEPAPTSAHPTAPRTAPHRPEDTLVMVADDSKVVRVKTSRLLAQHGYRVVLAEDGAEAARLIEQEVPCVLVTDVEMPGLDGFELTRLVRTHPLAADIPIIMITSADERLRAAAAAAGVTLVLGKPYPEAALLDCIQQTTAPAPATTTAAAKA